jgi:outer membrane protein assembly factor BamD (BamD/ComL family)
MRYFLILLLASLTIAAGAVAAPAPDGKFVFRDGQWVFVPADQAAPLTTPPQSAQPPARAPQPPQEPAPAPPPPSLPAQPTIVPATETPPVQKPVPPIEAQPAPPSDKPAGAVTPMSPTGVVRPMEPAKISPPPVEKPAEPAVVKPIEVQPAEPVAKPVAAPPAETATAAPAESPPTKPVAARGPVVPANPVKPPSAPGIQAAALRIEAAESPGVKYRTRLPQVAADEADRLLAALKDAPKSDSERILQSIAAYRAGQWTAAAMTAALLLKTSPKSPCAEAAKWLQAEAIFADGDLYAAFETYEEFIKKYAGSSLLEKSLRREMEVAEAFLTGTKRRLFGVLRVNAEDEGLAILQKVYDHRPTGNLAPDALFRRGEFQMQKKKYDEAEETFRNFDKEFPNHERARSAELLAAQAAMIANLGPVYGDASLKRANDQLEAYRDRHPDAAAAENVPQALEKIRQAEAQKKYEVAAYYLRAQKPRAAVFYARRVVREYPDTPAEAQARALLRKLGAAVDEEQGAQP